jgi:multicomponent Na+:H+ antiporter subunit G
MALAGDILMWTGIFFMGVAAIGLLRLPDFYTRAHTVSKTETLGLGLVILGLVFHGGASLVSIKLVLILIFGFLANPVAAHLITRAAVRSGVQMWTRESVRGPTTPEPTTGD